MFRLKAPLEYFEQIIPLSESSLPEPYHHLLTSTLLTSALEAFYEAEVHLQVIDEKMNEKKQRYQRSIMLGLEQKKEALGQAEQASFFPVSFSLISFYLNALPRPLYLALVQGNEPFGRLIKQMNIPVMSTESIFFSTHPQKKLAAYLGCSQEQRLYGRKHYLISRETKEKMAKVMDILAPL